MPAPPPFAQISVPLHWAGCVRVVVAVHPVPSHRDILLNLEMCEVAPGRPTLPPMIDGAREDDGHVVGTTAPSNLLGDVDGLTPDQVGRILEVCAKDAATAVGSLEVDRLLLALGLRVARDPVLCVALPPSAVCTLLRLLASRKLLRWVDFDTLAKHLADPDVCATLGLPDLMGAVLSAQGVDAFG